MLLKLRKYTSFIFSKVFRRFAFLHFALEMKFQSLIQTEPNQNAFDEPPAVHDTTSVQKQIFS